MFISCRDNLGITLIECMFALTLAMLIVGGFSSIYLSSTKNHLVEEAMQNIMMHSMIAFNQLNKDIQLSGYVGCSKLTAIEMQGPSDKLILPTNRIMPYIANDIKPGSDGVIVRHANSNVGLLSESMTSKTILNVETQKIINIGDILILSNCKTADIFEVKSITSIGQGIQQIESVNELSTVYPIHSEISKLESNAFYVSKTGRKDMAGADIHALYMRDQQLHKTELVEGVDNMIIRYIVNQQGTLIELKASEVYQPDYIVGVNIELSLSPLTSFSLHKKLYHSVALREV